MPASEGTVPLVDGEDLAISFLFSLPIGVGSVPAGRDVALVGGFGFSALVGVSITPARGSSTSVSLGAAAG